MQQIIRQYQRTIKECENAINSKQLDKKQTNYYKKLKKDTLKKMEFWS